MDPDKWLNEMQNLLNKIPKGHWLFTAPGGIYLMKSAPGGKRMVTEFGGMDPKAIVGKALCKDIDGGDW